VVVVPLLAIPIPASGPLKVGYVQSYNSGYAESDSVAFFLVNVSKGEIGRVDILNAHATNFTASDFNIYDVLFVAGDFNTWANTNLLSNALAGFLDAGGGVVSSFFPLGGGNCYGYNLGFTGEYAQKYLVFAGVQCLYEPTAAASLGKLEFPNHPVMKSVSNFTGSIFGIPYANATLVSGSYVVARWDTPTLNPMVAIRDDVGPFGLSRVDLGFWPNRNTIYPIPGVQQLEVNAILYVAGRLPYLNFTASTTGCTIPNVTAVVQQYLASGETISQIPAAGTAEASGSTTTITITVHNAGNTESIVRSANITVFCSGSSSLLSFSVWRWVVAFFH